MRKSRCTWAFINAVIILLLLVGQGSVQPVQAQDIGPAAEPQPQPELLKDIYVANGSSDPEQFLVNGNQVFYVASDPDHGEELWVSDGTPGGTHIVMDIFPGETGSDVSNLTLFRGQVYFSASPTLTDGDVRIWYTDGTAAGTVAAIQPYYNFTWMRASGDWLYFTDTADRVGRYGGVSNTIDWLLDEGVGRCYPDTEDPVMMGGNIYFSAADSSGCELWKFDPSTGQTARVKDITSGMSGTSIKNYTVSGSQLFFTASDSTYGNELWVSDGTDAGTHRVKDITDETEYFFYWYDDLKRTSTGNWLYFAADDGVHGVELWRTDGTEANTTMVADLAAGGLSSYPNHLTVIGSGSSQKVLFTARDGDLDEGHGVELWAVPVTQAGVPSSPVLIEIEPGSAGSFPKPFSKDWNNTTFPVIGNKVYFSAYDSAGGIELWESDGTMAGTVRTADGIPGPDGSAPTELVVWGSRLVYSAVDALHGREVWVSDPATGEAHMIADMATNPISMILPPSAGMNTNVGGRNIRYFVAEDPVHGRELWRTNGRPDGTQLVKDIFPGPESSMPRVEAGDAVEINGILYFICDDNNNNFGSALWRTDGTALGTWKLQPGALSQGASIIEIGAGGDTLYFIVTRNSMFLQETQLWKSNGTQDGTQFVKKLSDDSYPENCHDLYTLGETVIFQYSYNLWRSDGTATGTHSIQAFQSSSELLDASMVFGGRLYFNAPAPDGSDYRVLWYTDGTQDGTSQIQTAGAIPFRNPKLFTLDGNDFYFVAHKYDLGDNLLSASLWKIAGGQTSVSLVVDLIPLNPTDSSQPLFLTRLNNGKWMYFDELIYATHQDQWHVVDPTTGIRAPLCDEFNCYPDQVTFVAAWSGKVYFMANDLGGNFPYTMMVSDGTGIGTVTFNMPGTTTPFQNASNFLSTPNAFYFTVDDGVHGVEPWIIRAPTYNLYLPLTRRQ